MPERGGWARLSRISMSTSTSGRSAARELVILGPQPPPSGGVASFVHDLIVLLGPSATLWAIGGDERPDSHIGRSAWDQVRRLAKRPWRRRVIVDSSHMLLEYPAPRAALVWSILKWVQGTKWIKIVHDGSLPDRHEEFSLIRRISFRLSSYSIDHLVVTSEALRDWWATRRCVVPALTIAPLLADPSEATSHHDFVVDPPHPTVCSIGAFQPAYGFREVVAAVDEVRRITQLDVHLLLLASSFAKDSDYENLVVADQPWLTVRRDVTRAEALGCMQESAVVVRYTRWESYGLARAEALLLGTPVIGTPVGLTEGVILVDFERHDELVSALVDVVLTRRRVSSAVQDSLRKSVAESAEAIRTLVQAALA